MHNNTLRKRTFAPRQGSLAFYNEALSNLTACERVLLGLERFSFNQTGHLRKILQKAKVGELLTADESREINISAAYLMKPRVPLPELVKFASGIHFSECGTGDLAWHLFSKWYESQSNSKESWTLYNIPQTREQIRVKITNFVKNQRSLRLVMSSDDEDEDEEVCAPIDGDFRILSQRFNRAFNEFTRLRLCEEGFNFHNAFIQFIAAQPADCPRYSAYISSNLGVKARKAFTKRRRNACRKMGIRPVAVTDPSLPPSPSPPAVIDTQQRLMEDTLITGNLVSLNYREGEEVQFTILNETDRLRTWQKKKRLAKLSLSAYEHDVDSDPEEVKNAKGMLKSELKAAIDFFAHHEKADQLVQNVFIEDIVDMDTPKHLKLHDKMIPAYAAPGRTDTPVFPSLETKFCKLGF